jgi:hypothetical protein
MRRIAHERTRARMSTGAARSDREKCRLGREAAVTRRRLDERLRGSPRFGSTPPFERLGETRRALQLVASDRRGVHADERLSRTGSWRVGLLDRELVRTARRAQPDDAHHATLSVATSRRMAAATTKMAALNSATSSNAIDPNAEDNCDDAETGNAQESNGYEELPELQAVVIDRALHDELTADPTRPTERLLKG